MNPQIAASTYGIINIIFEPTVSEEAFTTPLVHRVGKRKRFRWNVKFPKKKKKTVRKSSGVRQSAYFDDRGCTFRSSSESKLKAIKVQDRSKLLKNLKHRSGS